MDDLTTPFLPRDYYREPFLQVFEFGAYTHNIGDSLKVGCDKCGAQVLCCWHGQYLCELCYQEYQVVCLGICYHRPATYEETRLRVVEKFKFARERVARITGNEVA